MLRPSHHHQPPTSGSVQRALWRHFVTEGYICEPRRTRRACSSPRIEPRSPTATIAAQRGRERSSRAPRSSVLPNTAPNPTPPKNPQKNNINTPPPPPTTTRPKQTTDDWLLALAIIVWSFTVPGPVIRPLQRHYSPDDPSLAYPSTPVPLSENQKFGLEFALPALVALAAQFATAAARGAPGAARLLDWHHLMLSVLEAFAVESAFKKHMNLVGRLRPDFLARLASGDAEAVEEGRLSYPSGHAAELFATMTALALYLAGRSRLFGGGAPAPVRVGGVGVWADRAVTGVV